MIEIRSFFRTSFTQHDVQLIVLKVPVERCSDVRYTRRTLFHFSFEIKRTSGVDLRENEAFLVRIATIQSV